MKEPHLLMVNDERDGDAFPCTVAEDLGLVPFLVD